MISKRERLTYREFSDKRYSVVRTPYFSLKMAPNNLSFHRIGVVIGKASIKSAVRRNFWRRQAFSAIDLIEGKSKDVMVIFSGGVGTLTKKAFRAEFAKAVLK